MKTVLAIPAFLFATAVAAQAPQPQVWTVTCSEGGRTVYLERMAGAPTPAKEQQVNAKFPSAICAYLAPETATNELPGIGAVIGNLQGPPGTPGDVAAALRVIRGEKIGVTPPASPVPASPVMALAPSSGLGVIVDDPVAPPAKPVPEVTKPGRIRLAVYGTLNNEDILADWHRRVEVQPLLRGYTPVLTHFEGRTLLSIERIRAEERETLCFLASSVGFSCIGAPVGADVAAVESLAMSYPSHFFVPEPEGMSLRIPEIGQGACGDAAAASGMECLPWPTAKTRAVNLLAVVKPAREVRPQVPVAKEARPQRRPGTANSSSTSAPRSRSAMASEAATSTRSASGLIR